MSGSPLETAKRVVARLLRSLVPEDRFEVLEFSRKTAHARPGPGEAKGDPGCLAKLEVLQLLAPQRKNCLEQPLGESVNRCYLRWSR